MISHFSHFSRLSAGGIQANCNLLKTELMLENEILGYGRLWQVACSDNFEIAIVNNGFHGVSPVSTGE